MKKKVVDGNMLDMANGVRLTGNMEVKRVSAQDKQRVAVDITRTLVIPEVNDAFFQQQYFCSPV